MGADSIYDEEELPIGGEQGKPQAAEAVTDHMPYANVSGKEIASGTRTTAKVSFFDLARRCLSARFTKIFSYPCLFTSHP